MVSQSVENNSGDIFALDAPGGTGKTFLLTTLLSYVRGNENIAIATATSAIAANLLPGGRTIHSRFNAPVEDIHSKSMCSIKENDSVAKLLKKTKLIVVDEVTMANKLLLECVDRSLRDILKSNRPFAGITTIFSGDWRQCLPIGKPNIFFQTLIFFFKFCPLLL